MWSYTNFTMDNSTIDSGFNYQNELEFTGKMKQDLLSTAKWARLISIVIIVFMAITITIVLASFFFMASSSPLSDELGIIGLYYSVLLIGLCVPQYFLYRFATNVRDGIRANDTGLVSEGIGFLRKHYKFIGILTCIGLAIMAMNIVIALLVGGSALFM